MAIKIQRRGGIAVVSIDNAPVNAIGLDEREGLLSAAHVLSDESEIRVIVLTGSGGRFAAGADAREFGAPPLAPHLPQVVDAIEASSKPWIAAIHGAALGGGLEIALACDFRIVAPDAVLGLPEVKLGLVPGAGGTQRLPRLIGVERALSMIVEGEFVSAHSAKTTGLVDEIATDPEDRAMKIAGAGIVKRRLSECPPPSSHPGAIDAARKRAARKARGEVAPNKAIELIELTSTTPFPDAVKVERETFLELRGSSQSIALRHLFFAERGSRVPASIADTSPRSINHCTVVGGGTMGTGIAYALLQAGIAVSLIETDEAGAERAKQNFDRILSTDLAQSRIDESGMERIRRRLRMQVGYDALHVTDFVIEAAFEDMAVKKSIFAALDKAAPRAILATNTSYLDINEIAHVTSRPEAFLGAHFFSPAHIMKLMEIVRADRTDDVALATAFALAKRLKKVPVLAGVCDGFIGNRILSRYRNVADMVLLDGGLPWEVDEAMVEFGYALGPYEAQDMAGLDIAYANRKQLAKTRDPKRRYVAISDRMVAEGRIGRKVGVGWYRYPGGGGSVIDPLLEDLIREESHFAKVARRPFTHDEIRRRLLAAMINEAAELLREGVAGSATDIDLVTVHGYGFPRWRGGLMRYASEYGFERVLKDVLVFADQDPEVWRPTEGLIALTKQAQAA